MFYVVPKICHPLHLLWHVLKSCKFWLCQNLHSPYHHVCWQYIWNDKLITAVSVTTRICIMAHFRNSITSATWYKIVLAVQVSTEAGYFFLILKPWEFKMAANSNGAHMQEGSCFRPLNEGGQHYGDVTMGAITSQITSLMIVYSTVYSGADQSKHQSSASLAFVWEIHRGPGNFPHKWPVTRKMFPFDDVIMRKMNFLLEMSWNER